MYGWSGVLREDPVLPFGPAPATQPGKPDFVGFVAWPIVGGVAGWLIAAVCYLMEMTSSNPHGEWGLFLLVVGSVYGGPQKPDQEIR